MAGLLKPIREALDELLAQYGVNDYAFALRGPGVKKPVRIALWVAGTGGKENAVLDIDRLERLDLDLKRLRRKVQDGIEQIERISQ